jgi:glucan phosphoethanolaminetransferase (alkaline phosphatase superfamily)
MTIDVTTERLGIRRPRPSVRWFTVVPLAVVMAYADGFWMTSLRGAVGAVERTQEPFATWLRESTLSLPVYVLAVLGVLTLAARWFGPALRTPKTVVAAALLIVAAGTVVGIAELAVSSAYDYHLQSSQVQRMSSMPGMESMSSTMGSTAQQQQASLNLQVRTVGFGSGLLLVTNLVLVGWVVAARGGRLDFRKTPRGELR